MPVANPPRGRPPWLPHSLFPFESRFLDVRGCRVHYVDEGGGPPLLLLHGNPTYSLLYRDIIRRLSPRFRCVAVDYPGFGLSTAPEGYDFRPASHSQVLEDLVVALGLSGLTVMVQDWGGPIGLGLAGRRPDLFRFEQLLPRHRTVMLRGAGHYIQEDAPAEIGAAIESWWSEEVERAPWAEPAPHAPSGDARPPA